MVALSGIGEDWTIDVVRRVRPKKGLVPSAPVDTTSAWQSWAPDADRAPTADESDEPHRPEQALIHVVCRLEGILLPVRFQYSNWRVWKRSKCRAPENSLIASAFNIRHLA